MLSLVQRVVARFAGRVINIRPVDLKPCRDCGGDGVHTEPTYDVKNLCVRCWGTGTEPDTLKALRAEVDEIAVTYQAKQVEFDEAKAKAMGRGGRHLGMMGRDLQTLNAFYQRRKKVLDHEKARVDTGKRLAKVAGAAAR